MKREIPRPQQRSSWAHLIPGPTGKLSASGVIVLASTVAISGSVSAQPPLAYSSIPGKVTDPLFTAAQKTEQAGIRVIVAADGMDGRSAYCEHARPEDRWPVLRAAGRR